MTVIATALHRGAPEHAVGSLCSSLRNGLKDQPPKLVVVFASPNHPLSTLVPGVAASMRSAVVVGASSAGEFTEQGDAKLSSCAFALTGDEYAVRAGLGSRLRERPEAAVLEALMGIALDLPGYAHRTAIVLLDPLSGNAEEATIIAGAMLGSNVRIVGGAAADDLKMARTLVGCGTQVGSNAVVIAMIYSRVPLGIGVSHGHRALDAPRVRVTRAEGGLVHELDGFPAWEVWRNRTRAAARAQGINVDALSAYEEGAFLLRYEGGLATGEGKLKIRAPLARVGATSIQFACGVPEGSVLHITESSASAQIESVREAARSARLGLVGGRASGALVFDCICRSLILGNEFRTALRGLSEELDRVPMAGFETYGEVALDAGDMSGFHNTTSVVLAFPK